MDLNGFKYFVEVVQQGSFSAAAKELNTPVSTVSRKVSELEASVGYRLLERSTRKLRLTETGMLLFDHALRGIQEMEAGVYFLQERQQHLKGRLRMAIPPSFEPAWVVLEAFQEKYPDVNVQVLALSRTIDPIADGVDIAIQFGQTSNLSLISRVMVTNRRMLVASQAFLKQHGQPSTPNELTNFPCLAWGNPSSQTTWQLGTEEVTFTPYSMSNEFSLLKYMALSGRGIALLPPYFCKNELASGEFVHLLPDYSAPEIIIPITYSSRKQLSPVTRAFIDFTAEFIKEYETDLWASPHAKH